MFIDQRMKWRVLKIVVVLGCVAIVFCNCTRRRGSSKRQRISSRSSNPKQAHESKTDTFYMVVPIPCGNDESSKNEYSEIVLPSSKKLKPLVHDDGWPSPPKIEFQRPTKLCTREEYIKNHEITGDLKNLVIACDYDNSIVRNNAAALVSMSPGTFNLGQICDIFDFCYMNWSYINDPITSEYFAKASETLNNGLNGDCDDFAILVCSMILSVGGEARVSFVYNEGKGHAFAEVNIGKTSLSSVKRYLIARYNVSELNHKVEGDDCWLNLDWWGEYPGAKYWDYQKGTCFNIVRNECKEL